VEQCWGWVNISPHGWQKLEPGKLLQILLASFKKEKGRYSQEEQKEGEMNEKERERERERLVKKERER
jgi:hypothetical protein